MNELNPKLTQALKRIEEAGGMVPWSTAPKRHRQLADLGLVLEGKSGDQRWAVLTTALREPENDHGHEQP